MGTHTKMTKTVKSEAEGPHGPPASALNVMESVCWLFCTMVYFTWYNPIGELSKSWDTGDSVLQRIDDQLSWMDDYVPYVPSMIFPYVLVYAMPVAYLVSLCSSFGFDLGRVRRFFMTQMAMITVAFVLYLAFPCKTDLLLNTATMKYEYNEESWVGRLCYKFVHQGISLYVAFPSMHTAHAFSIAAAFEHDKLRGKSLALALAFITLLSTVMTKAHRPPHLPLGYALAYAGQKLVFDRVDLPSMRPTTSSWQRFYMVAMAPVLFIVLGRELHRVSGWKTDVPAMFGFESNPVIGLYGF